MMFFNNLNRPILIILILFSFSSFSQKKTKKEKPKTIDSLTKEMSIQKGLITTFFNDNKLFFEIHDSILNIDLLMVTRFVKLPENYSAYINAGSKTSENLIQFKKNKKNILIIQKSYINNASNEDPISLSVEQNNFPPILGMFEIKNIEKKRYLIDVSKYFNQDSPGFNIIRPSLKKKYKIGNVDSKRSFINTSMSYPKNTEVRHTLTFSSNNAQKNNNSKTLTFQINHSIIKLPENPMQVRFEDHRVGWFTLKVFNYSSDKLKSDNYKIIRRWRLEPSDIKAYNNGELVEPIKPIIYYLDPATPKKWRPYFIKGIEDWNKVFEKAGFKNAIKAKVPPSEKENPEFSPEDIRFSTVRYVASTTRNAVGPSVSDPRTGEIIESDIIWYHNHLKSYRNRYLLETGAANPSARTLDTPEEDIGEMMRRVISHEVGHALGLPHNMKASSAYPVDSLRSGAFTQKMGIATTIMDYARYNYVAQPEDKNIRFIRQLGPYDDYSINWGYRYYSDKTPNSEIKILNKIVDEKSLNPIYMFGYNGFDPDSQTENIGDDPVKSSNYGLNNLKIVSKNLETWTTKKGQNFNDLKELYSEMLSVYRRYIFHVIRIIGGVNETKLNKGQNKIYQFENVNVEKQKIALKFLNENLWKSQYWLIDKKIISKIDYKGGLNRISNIQKSAINYILNIKKLNRNLSSQKTLNGTGMTNNMMIETLINNVIIERVKPDVLERNIQKHLLIKLIDIIKNKELETEIKGLIHLEIKNLKKHFKKYNKQKNNMLKAHYMYCFDLLKDY